MVAQLSIGVNVPSVLDLLRSARLDTTLDMYCTALVIPGSVASATPRLQPPLGYPFQEIFVSHHSDGVQALPDASPAAGHRSIYWTIPSQIKTLDSAHACEWPDH